MKFKCNQAVLMEALNNVVRAVPQKSTIPALEGVKLFLDGSTLEITGYDLELGIQTKIQVDSADYGEVIVSARLFSDMVRKMDSQIITVEIDEGLKTTISGESAKYNIIALPADEYPALPDFDTGESFELPQSVLKNMINQTVFAVAADDKKPILTGELFDIENGEFNLVAIDGYRLAVRHELIPTEDRYNFVVKAKALMEAAKLLKDEPVRKEEPRKEPKEGEEAAAPAEPPKENKVILNVSKKHIIFDINGYMVISRLLEGDFHNYKASIPSEFSTEIVIKTKDLLGSLERCSLLINDKTKAPVRCVFDAGHLKITCSTVLGRLSDEIPAAINGKMVEIGFNCRYLYEAVKATESDKIKLRLNGGLSPMKIIPLDGDDYTFLVLPVRLKNE